MSLGIIEVNVRAVYSGHTVTFTFNDTLYRMETDEGIRGTMPIHLISIDSGNMTYDYDWRYSGNNDRTICSNGFKTINKL